MNEAHPKAYSAVIIFVLALAALPTQKVQAVSTDIVISQVYGGGGNPSATLTNDYIELFNRGTSSVSLAGWSVQYTSATGTIWQVTLLGGVIQPGQYFLIQEAAGAGGTTPLPTPDVLGMIQLGAISGKVALVNSVAALTGSGCPFNGSVVDFIGYGLADCFEGMSPGPTLDNTIAALRAAGGCTDTDQNLSDFSSASPNPRNTGSPFNVCGGIPTSTPTATITDTPTMTPTVTPTSTGIPNGGICDDPIDCMSRSCVDDTCCAEASCPPGQSCDNPGYAGNCSPDPTAPAPAVSRNGVLLALAILVGIGAVAVLRTQQRA